MSILRKVPVISTPLMISRFSGASGTLIASGGLNELSQYLYVHSFAEFQRYGSFLEFRGVVGDDNSLPSVELISVEMVDRGNLAHVVVDIPVFGRHMIGGNGP